MSPLRGLSLVRIADGEGSGGVGVGLAGVEHSGGLAVEEKRGRSVGEVEGDVVPLGAEDDGRRSASGGRGSPRRAESLA